MQKKRIRAGFLYVVLLLILLFTYACFGSAKTGNAMMPSATAEPTLPIATITPSSGVLSAEATPSPTPSQSPKATTATLAATPTPSATAGQPEQLSAMLTNSKLSFSKIAGTQLVMVVYEKGNTKLYCYEKGYDGIWKLTLGPVTANVGRNGVSAAKKEGDGKTPTGLYSFGFAFGNGLKPDTSMTYRKVTGDSYWVDDPDSKYYNTWVEGAEQKDWDSAEHLSEMKTAYEFAAVIEYNANPITPGKGSAIFLHCGSNPTAGCVAIGRSNVLAVLKWLKPSAKPQILITAK